jgi:CPA1 family monovalent cation:H+ antiporter
MAIFETVIALLVVSVGLAALARRWHAPYPALLAGLGVVLALVPGTPHVVLDPRLALALFVAPVLLDAAYDTSMRDLKDNWIPIIALVVNAVIVTTVAVALAVKWLAPDLPWAAAIALGAIVAPPDAAAASAILKEAKLPHRLGQILSGESLLNDATALLIYRVAVGMLVGEAMSPFERIPLLVLVVAGSLVFGWALARLFAKVQRHIEDVPTSIVMQFCGTFAVWIAAERIGLSGILTIVAYAVTIARRAPHTTPARIRVPSYAVWETVVFVLNVLAFVLIGLQLRPILEGLSAADQSSYARVAVAVLGVVIVTRLVWVMTFNARVRWRFRRLPPERREGGPTIGGGLLVSWCGMRGIVTLAAALALPAGFPGRPLILVTAFTVVVGTLLIQGLTLRPLLFRLDLHDDGPVEREVAHARGCTLRAALQAIDGDTSESANTLRFELEDLLADGTDDEDGNRRHPTLPLLRQRAVQAARKELKRLRFDHTIGDDAYHRVEVVLDRTELYAEAAGPAN